MHVRTRVPLAVGVAAIMVSAGGARPGGARETVAWGAQLFVESGESDPSAPSRVWRGPRAEPAAAAVRA
jgi:hypothetical protein